MDTADRRTHPRFAVAGPCKLYLPRAGRYVAGATINRSDGGVLIDVGRPTFFEAGERLRVGMAEGAILPVDDMRDAFVAWTVRTPEHTLVGLRFAPSQDVLAQAA